jgi:hypothetical protein
MPTYGCLKSEKDFTSTSKHNFPLTLKEYTQESALGDSLNLQITISSEYLKKSEALNHQIAGISKTSMVS